MQKITTFLTFNDQAEAAMKLYTSVFGGRITSENRQGKDGPLFGGSFEIDGQTFHVLNGGPTFTFAQGTSLFVRCETQAEVDDLWAKLTANGGEPGRCGWLKDPFGVSWQIIPTVLGQLLQDPDPARAQRAMKAMLGMSKIDIAALQRAADGDA